MFRSLVFWFHVFLSLVYTGMFVAVWDFLSRYDHFIFTILMGAILISLAIYQWSDLICGIRHGRVFDPDTDTYKAKLGIVFSGYLLLIFSVEFETAFFFLSWLTMLLIVNGGLIVASLLHLYSLWRPATVSS